MPSINCRPPLRISFTKTFLKAYKRCKSSGRYNLNKVKDALDMLASRQNLPPSYRDHELIGNWCGYRECHLGGDFLLFIELKTIILSLLLCLVVTMIVFHNLFYQDSL